MGKPHGACAMATEASATRASLPGSSPWRDLLRKEDWWAVWLGVGLTLLAVWLFQTGSSLKWLAVTPKKWSTLPEALADLRTQAPRYLALLAMWSALLGAGARALGLQLRQFLPSFVFVFAVAIVIFTLGQWT